MTYIIEQLKNTDKMQLTNPQLQANKGMQPKIQQLKVRSDIHSGHTPEDCFPYAGSYLCPSQGA